MAHMVPETLITEHYNEGAETTPHKQGRVAERNGSVFTSRRGCCAKALLFLGVLFMFLCIPVMEMQYRGVYEDEPCHSSTEDHSRIVHQIWINMSAKNFPTPWNTTENMCRMLNPDYTYKLWSAEDIEAFLAKEYPWILDTYHGYRYSIQRTSAARYFILYHYGGVYIDMDLKCVQSFSSIVEEMSEYDILLGRGDTCWVSNHILIAKPRHPFMRRAMSMLKEYSGWRVFPYLTIIYNTGPGFLSTVLRHYQCKQEIYIFPRRPKHNIYYINMRSGSWHTWDSWFMNAIVWHSIKQASIGIKWFCSSMWFVISLILAAGVFITYRIRKRRQSPGAAGVPFYKLLTN